MSDESKQAITLLPHVANVVNKFRFVSVGTGGLVDETLAGADAQGVTEEASLANASVAIGVSMLDGGKVTVEAGGTVTAGDVISSDAVGRAITIAATVTHVGLGIALTSATIGEAVTVLVSKAAGNQTVS